MAPTPQTERAQLRVRVPAAFHDRLKDIADQQGVTLNNLVLTLLAGSVSALSLLPPEEAER